MDDWRFLPAFYFLLFCRRMKEDLPGFGSCGSLVDNSSYLGPEIWGFQFRWPMQQREHRGSRIVFTTILVAAMYHLHRNRLTLLATI
ncbi:hypothetical protein BJY01DRAFT_205031 [Aspergillus pseudoustus]|uniref:Secreted protein n=1 Tax=Aspergillus pseudoustus TaxID=1810923 RepID=A0ABR4KRH9_9EURO